MKKSDAISIRYATPADVPTIHAMADVVFRKTYREILSPEQIDYMMDWMYSIDSLKVQVAGEGKWFLLAEAREDGEQRKCGYASFETEGRTSDGRPLFHLQKLYVMPEWQGCGLGEKLLNAVVDGIRSVAGGPARMELNVNRYNRAVSFYEKMGLKRDRQGDFEIGHGWYMNDYIYALDILP